jgi:hypothetical protein
MADRKISDLTALTTPASGDYVPIVDISEVAAASKNKRITIQSLFQGIPVNVGVGTSSPGYALDVASADTTASIGYALRIRANATAGAGALQFTDSAATAQYGLLAFGANGVGTLQADGASSRLLFSTNSTERARIDSSGKLLVGTSSDSGGALLQVNDNRIRIATAKTPSSASDTGTAGEICWDADYIYVCTATNTWKRTAISTW